MKNIIIKGLVIVCSIACYSCIPQKKGEVESQNEVSENLSDSAEYYVVSFYPDDQLRLRGNIKNQKKHGFWTEWYTDGKVRSNVEYVDGEVILDEEYENSAPKVTLDRDSLRIGVKSYLRAIDFYPHEVLKCSDNVELKALEDNSEYDFEITPLTTDSIIFYMLREAIMEKKQSDGSNIVPMQIILGKAPVYR